MSSGLKKFIESCQDKIDYSFPGIPEDFHDDKHTAQLGLEMVMRNNKLYMYKMDKDDEEEEDEEESQANGETNGTENGEEEELPREEVLRRKIVTSFYIPWDAGTNKFASQKGMGAFGKLRDVTNCNGGAEQCDEAKCLAPLLSGVHWKGASQSGESPFGGQLNQVRRVLIGGEKKSHVEIQEPEASKFLSRWVRPNPLARFPHLYGGPRDPASHSEDSENSTLSEVNKMRSETVLPRLCDMSMIEPPELGTGVVGGGWGRQVATPVDGLDFTYEEELESRKHMPWLLGPYGMETQAHTGGFGKQRDVANETWYDPKPDTVFQGNL